MMNFVLKLMNFVFKSPGDAAGLQGRGGAFYDMIYTRTNAQSYTENYEFMLTK